VHTYNKFVISVKKKLHAKKLPQLQANPALIIFPSLNLPPQFPIPLIPLHIPVSGRSKGVHRCSLGVPLPVAPGLLFPDSRGAGTNGFLHALPAVAVGAQSQGDHGVHAGVILNGQMPADILQVGIIGRCRIAGPNVRHRKRPLLGLPLLGGLRILMVNPSGQSKRLAALPALRKQKLHLRERPVFPPMLWLAVLKARRAVGMDAAAQLFVAVLPVQALRDAVAHTPVKFRAQPGNGQHTLVIPRLAFQHHGGPEAVLL